MRIAVVAVLSSALLAVGPAASGAQTRFFLGGGPTGTSAFGFRGGWGGSLGVEYRLGEAGAFLARAEASAVPSSPENFYAIAGDLGQPSPGSSDATLLSLMAGLRLGGSGSFCPYLDALAGVGYLNDPNTLPVLSYYSGSRSNDHVNIALSVGPGLAIRPPFGPAVFADVHYDFYFVDRATTPVIPVRLGVMVP